MKCGGGGGISRAKRFVKAKIMHRGGRRTKTLSWMDEEHRGGGRMWICNNYMTKPKSAAAVICVFLSILLPTASSQQQSDNRCFLDGGGAAETFFTKESLAVGATLGTLRVIGEVGQDIRLRLEEGKEAAPVDVDINTKNLVLTKPLDKEDIDGPSSVSVNVLCERIGSKDPVFPIPVTIRVTDVNDNAPKFVDSPYSLNLSELTLVGSRIFSRIRAVDADQLGPFSTVEYSVAGGKLSDYVTFENPLEGGSLVLTKQLDYETLKSFQVKVVARDQGSPPRENETLLTINVQDADDQNPAFFFDHYDALLPEGGSQQGQKLMVQPQDIKAFDKDAGLGSPTFYQFNANSDEYKYFELNRNTGHIYVKADIPDNEFLQPVTLVVKATQFDNPDRYAVTTLTVTRGGIFDSGDLQFLQKAYDVKILENVPLNSVVTTLLTNRPSDRRVHFSLETLPGDEFSVNEKGDVVLRKTLDFETLESYSFIVHATDGRKNDSAVVNVTLLNINDWDPRFKYPQYEFFVSAEDAFDGFVVGTIEVHDGDKGDRVTLDVKGPYARVFTINSRGELAIQDMRHLNSSDAHVVIVAEDSGVPPRKASVPVVVKFAKEVAARIQGAAAVGDLFYPLDTSIVIVIFATVLLLFFAVIVTLTIYICKHRKRYNRQRRFAAGSSAAAAMEIGGNPKLMANYLQAARANEYQKGKMSRGGGAEAHNPAFHRSSDLMILQHQGSVSSTDTVSSGCSPTTNGGSQLPAGQVLNPLNPRSGSQRYAKNVMLRLPPTAKVSPAAATYSNQQAPPPSPSIHSNGLPDLMRPLSISADPMPIYNGAKSKQQQQQGGSVTGSVVSGVSSSSVQSLRFSLRSGSDFSLQQALRENILGKDLSSAHRLQWPRNSIPRRVKKLSWEDEYGSSSEACRDRDMTLMTDPNVSVTPMLSEPQIGRAIYF